MKKTSWLPALLLALAGCANTDPIPVRPAAPEASAPVPAASDASAKPVQSSGLAWSVHFSPKGGCTQAVTGFIGGARSTVRLQAYGFTSQAVADALIAAGKSGKDVQIILDRSDRSAPSSKAAYVAASGVVKVWIDAKHAIAHSKVVVVDSSRVETGSFNYTEAAESSNSENCLILEDPNIAYAYTQNWEAHLAHSTPYP